MSNSILILSSDIDVGVLSGRELLGIPALLDFEERNRLGNSTTVGNSPAEDKGGLNSFSLREHSENGFFH